ncbi:MAG TPA: hypothetical protein VFN92_11295 [Solirubrobacterales bacterium]|nr:hypothetical protein [Solirubrobacterales bacterium]
MIREFVPRRGTVLDPLGGVGTLGLEGALQGRRSVSNDKSPFAAIVARAKLDPPSIDTALEALSRLAQRMGEVTLDAEDAQAADFGLNATVRDYFHPETLDELLRARKVLALHPPVEGGEYFVWASLLHVLHGNRPYAVSRTSHPITPFSPTGPFEYRGVIERTERKIRLALSAPLPEGFEPGQAFEGDFRALPDRLASGFDAIVTSPPFLGMRFDRPNWLRLWFCGWTEESFRTESRSFLEREQVTSWECYSEFFDVCHDLLASSGTMILHLGSSGSDPMLAQLRDIAASRFTLIGEVAEAVGGKERHGLRDKGRTTAHHLLFFRSRRRRRVDSRDSQTAYSVKSGTGLGRSSKRALIEA